MLKTYIELINKYFAKEFKKQMRDGAKAFYRQDLQETDCLMRILTSDGDIGDGLIEEAAMEMLYECVRKGFKFGDYKIEHAKVTDGTGYARRSYDVTTVTMPIVT